MMLDGIVYAPDSTTSAETRSSGDAANTDQVFNQFLTLSDQAGPDRCALAGHGEPAAARVACENQDTDPAHRYPVRPQHAFTY